jgi:hypothetical protein
MPKIFLSYRRQDSAGISGRIYDRLAKRFGAKAIFMDIDSIPSGVDFRSYVRSALIECEVVLVVIGRDWEGNGPDRRRIDDPDDFVRIEVETALERALPVIPIVIDRVKMLAKADLPTTLEGLAFLNGVFLDQGRHFHHQTGELIASIERLLKRRSPVGWISAKKAAWLTYAARRREIANAKKAARSAKVARRREIAASEKAERVNVAALDWNITNDVFISYAEEDRAQCDVIFEKLTCHGIRAMRSKNSTIVHKDDRTATVGHVRVERCFLLLLSKNTFRSAKVSNELRSAIEARNKRQISRLRIFRLDDDDSALRTASSFGLNDVINRVEGSWVDDYGYLLGALKMRGYLQLALCALIIISIIIYGGIVIFILAASIRTWNKTNVSHPSIF